MKNLMQTRNVAILSVMLAIAVFLPAGPLVAQPLEGSKNGEAAHEVYAPSLTPAIYLVNFLLLYMANPDLAAYMPAYKAPIPHPVVDCLEQNPMAAAMLITGNTSISRFSIRENASGRTFARRMRDGRAWRHASSHGPNRSTSHWGEDEPISSLTFWASTKG